MSSDLLLRRKLTLRAHGRQVVLIKKRVERIEHVLMKAFRWALYLPAYPDLSIEIDIGDRYKPDVVHLDARGRPVFWGEAGKVGLEKIRSITRRFRDTHFAVAKWATPLAPSAHLIEEAIAPLQRSAPIDLIGFPPDSAARFIGSGGQISLTHHDVEWSRLGEDL
jgi:hypothetical protein